MALSMYPLLPVVNFCAKVLSPKTVLASPNPKFPVLSTSFTLLLTRKSFLVDLCLCRRSRQQGQQGRPAPDGRARLRSG